MRKRLLGIVVGVAVLASVAGGGSALGGGEAAKPVKLKEATMIVEVNATDGDAGLQVFLDGDPWRKITITAPNGRRIAGVATLGQLKGYGLTELFSESSEPSFDVFPLEKFKELFPAGRYTFAGETIEGAKLTGAARLSHAIPAGPKILAPSAGAKVDRGAAVARWAGVPETGGIDIVGYRAIVTREDGRLRIFSADLPASARKVTIPREFLEAGIEYKLEVQSIERSGNQTLTEITFRAR
jgi:hypothetical protein